MTLFCKGLEHLQIWVSVGSPGTNPHPSLMDTMGQDNCISKKTPGNADVTDPLTILLKALRSTV